MAFLSKIGSFVSRTTTRKIHTSQIKNRGLGIVPDPNPILDEFNSEPHAEKLGGIVKFCLWVFIPVLSAYCWYLEYDHMIAHPHRRPFPRYEFLHARTKKLPFGDGEHGPWHNYYLNFTPNGYETDKDGNRLPKGVYAYE